MPQNMIKELQEQLLNDPAFVGGIGAQLQKADTFGSSSNQLVWYDLERDIKFLYPFIQLIPLISKLPRVPANGGNATHWQTSQREPGTLHNSLSASILAYFVYFVVILRQGT